MKKRTSRISTAFFFLIVIFICVTIFLSYWNLNILHYNDTLVIHTLNVISNVRGISQDVRLAEINERNYILTNNTSYIPAYQRAVTKTKKEISLLQILIHDNPIQVKNVHLLSMAVTKRFDLLQQDITYFQTSGLDATQENSYINSTTQQTTTTNALLTALESNERQLLSRRSNQTNTSYINLYTVFSSASILNIVLVTIAFYLISRELKKHSIEERRKDDFVSMASHELKSPITSLKIFVTLLKNEVRKSRNRKIKTYIGKIDTQTDRLASLITELLDITRVKTGKLRYEKKPTSIQKLITDTVDAFQETTKKHQIRIKGVAKKKVYVDQFRIYQVLVNLLSNAIKYSPQGGNITVIVRQLKNDLLIGVKDTGIGIEKKEQKKIFENLYQVEYPLRNTTSGLGMGLYIAYEIVKNHDGKMWVESTPSKGSVFYFTLPYAPR